ncbi:TadE/TadG family type IV pilus assembly protein [Phenylobacterium sp.]|uniref:TadE/TadG family type IV pilus assembly protein n=1 Tax=Phenylobacterium sp. TaxID=1871053 RepID=UPI00391C0EE3
MLRFLRDARGAAALEFGLILPFLFVMHLTIVELVQAWQVRTRITHIASSLADVTSQERSVSDSDLADILLAGDAMIRPYPATPLGERVTSLVSDPYGVVRVDWTVSRNFPSSPPASAPAGFLQPNESILVADVVYDYQPALHFFLKDNFRLKHTSYVRPRMSAKVEKR